MRSAHNYVAQAAPRFFRILNIAHFCAAVNGDGDGAQTNVKCYIACIFRRLSNNLTDYRGSRDYVRVSLLQSPVASRGSERSRVASL